MTPQPSVTGLNAVQTDYQQVDTDAPVNLIQEVPYSRELHNTITLIGNLGLDPTMRETPFGTSCELRLAYRGPTRPGDEPKTEWHDVVIYDSALAPEAAATLRKGQRIAIRGRLRIGEWTDRVTGAPRQRHKIIVDQIATVAQYDAADMQSGQPGAQAQAPPPPQYQQQQQDAEWGEYGQPPPAANWEPEDQTGETPANPAPQYAPAPRGRAQNDLMWEAYFKDPGAFYDNRTDKMNPKAPDFKSKDRSMAMWLNSAPQWAKDRLDEIDAQSGVSPMGDATEPPPF